MFFFDEGDYFIDECLGVLREVCVFRFEWGFMLMFIEFELFVFFLWGVSAVHIEGVLEVVAAVGVVDEVGTALVVALPGFLHEVLVVSGVGVGVLEGVMKVVVAGLGPELVLVVAGT